MRLPFNSVLYAVKDYMVIIFGLLLYALGWVGFLLPNEITTGGVTGIAALIYYGTKIPVSVSYFTINVVLLLAAIKVLGLKFFVRTIFSVFMCSFFLGILPEFIPHSLVEEQPFMSAIIGGILCGLGVGLVFVSNGSTGGTDIIAAIVNKYKNISFAKMMMYIDFLIIASSYVLFHSIEKMIFGYVVMGVMANPFYQDLGFTKEEVAAVSKVFGVVMTLLGAFLGGIISAKFGVMKTLFLGALLSALTNLLFSWLALQGHQLTYLVFTVSADNLAAGIASVAFLAYLSGLTNVAHTATQYALFSSIMLLLPKFLAGFSGFVVESVGYSHFFTLTAVIGIPVLILVIWASHVKPQN